eukprot:UN04193
MTTNGRVIIPIPRSTLSRGDYMNLFLKVLPPTGGLCPYSFIVFFKLSKRVGDFLNLERF